MYRREGPTCLSRVLLLVIGALVVVAVLWAFDIFNPFDNLTGKPESNVGASGPAIVQQLRARNEWITFSYTADQLISAEISGNFLQNLLYGDRILLQARGEVAGGIDMSELKDDSIIVNSNAVTMTLPPARIIYSKLDNSQTRIYDRERGWLSKGDVDLESSARLYAEQSILQSACEAKVLDRAADQAKVNIEDLLKAVGYTSVTVYVSKMSDCEQTGTNIPIPTPNPAGEPTAPPDAPLATPPQTIATPPSSNTQPTSSNGGLTGPVAPITPTP